MATTDPTPDMRPPLQIEIMGQILTDIRTGALAAMDTVLSAPEVAARYAATLTSRPDSTATGCDEP